MCSVHKKVEKTLALWFDDKNMSFYTGRSLRKGGGYLIMSAKPLKFPSHISNNYLSVCLSVT